MAGSAWRDVLTPRHGTRRLALGAIVGVAVGFASDDLLRLPLRIAAGWVVAVAIYLALTALILGSAGPDECRQNARHEDPSRSIILGLLVTAAGVSLLALGYSFGKVSGETNAGLTLRLLFGALTILASWTLTHTIFGLHYTHHFYGDDETREGLQDRGGMQFPGVDEPDYGDFLYFSFVIGMTCQVSDVAVTSRSARRMVLAHGVLSFFFNTFILALAVNFVAGSLG